jgi:hypothetical protein
MSNQVTLAAFAAASLALSSIATAEDARITCTGTVVTIGAGGVGTQPFAGAAVGETVSITFDVEIARQLPFGDYLYLVNSPSSSIAIGAARDGFAFVSSNSFHLRNDFLTFGDVLALGATLATDSSTTFQLYLNDATGQAWNTQDVRDLYGTNVPLTLLSSLFRVQSPQGWLELTLTSLAIDPAPGSAVGTAYCAGAPNSTGAIGTTSAFGLQTPGDNDLTLTASGLPTQTFGYFIVSADQGFVAGAGGSSGNLCLSGAIGRFVEPGQVLHTDFGGEIALPVDLRELPSPTGALVVQAGQTWNFQLWHRDEAPTGSTSNFTRGLAVTFL